MYHIQANCPPVMNIYKFNLNHEIKTEIRAGEGISEPLSDILYNLLSDELFKHPATQIESLVLSCR